MNGLVRRSSALIFLAKALILFRCTGTFAQICGFTHPPPLRCFFAQPPFHPTSSPHKTCPKKVVAAVSAPSWLAAVGGENRRKGRKGVVCDGPQFQFSLFFYWQYSSFFYAFISNIFIFPFFQVQNLGFIIFLVTMIFLWIYYIYFLIIFWGGGEFRIFTRFRSLKIIVKKFFY